MFLNINGQHKLFTFQRLAAHRYFTRSSLTNFVFPIHSIVHSDPRTDPRLRIITQLHAIIFTAPHHYFSAPYHQLIISRPSINIFTAPHHYFSRLCANNANLLDSKPANLFQVPTSLFLGSAPSIDNFSDKHQYFHGSTPEFLSAPRHQLIIFSVKHQYFLGSALLSFDDYANMRHQFLFQDSTPLFSRLSVNNSNYSAPLHQ